MTQEELNKVQKIWDRAARLIGIAEAIEMGGEHRMDGMSVDDMKCLMNYTKTIAEKYFELKTERDELKKAVSDYQRLCEILGGK